MTQLSNRAPKSVRNQAKQAAKMQEQLNQGPADTATEEEQPKDGTPEDKAQEAKTSTPPEDGGEKNLDQSQVTDEGKAPEQAQPEKDKTDWKKRFDGLKATYDREVPKLRGELERSYSDIDDLKSEIKELKESIQSVTEKSEAAPAELNLTADEQEQYGGLIEVVQKVADQRIAEKDKEIAELRKTLGTLKTGQEEIRKDTTVSREQNFFNELTRAVSDWQTINTDEGFIEFLDEPVPYTNGRTRKEFLADARSNLDSVAAAQFFQDFKDSLGMSQGGESQVTTPEVPATPEVPEEIVVPNTASGGIPPAAEVKVYTHAEVDRFYRDKREGRYKGNESEARKIEQDILAAGTQGRIVARRMPVTA